MTDPIPEWAFPSPERRSAAGVTILEVETPPMDAWGPPVEASIRLETAAEWRLKDLARWSRLVDRVAHRSLTAAIRTPRARDPQAWRTARSLCGVSGDELGAVIADLGLARALLSRGDAGAEEACRDVALVRSGFQSPERRRLEALVGRASSIGSEREVAFRAVDEAFRYAVALHVDTRPGRVLLLRGRRRRRRGREGKALRDLRRARDILLAAGPSEDLVAASVEAAKIGNAQHLGTGTFHNYLAPAREVATFVSARARAQVLEQRGAAWRLVGSIHESDVDLKHAAEAYVGMGDVIGLCHAERERAATYRSVGQPGAVLESLGRTIRAARVLADPETTAAGHLEYARCLLALPEPPDWLAERHLTLARRWYRLGRNRLGGAHVLVERASMLSRQGRYRHAARALRRARRRYAFDRHTGIIPTTLALAELDLARGRPLRAIPRLLRAALGSAQLQDAALAQRSLSAVVEALLAIGRPRRLLRAGAVDLLNCSEELLSRLSRGDLRRSYLDLLVHQRDLVFRAAERLRDGHLALWALESMHSDILTAVVRAHRSGAADEDYVQLLASADLDGDWSSRSSPVKLFVTAQARRRQDHEAERRSGPGHLVLPVGSAPLPPPRSSVEELLDAVPPDAHAVLYRLEGRPNDDGSACRIVWIDPDRRIEVSSTSLSGQEQRLIREPLELDDDPATRTTATELLAGLARKLLPLGLRDALAGSSAPAHVVVVPRGDLWRLPFAALMVDDRPLVDLASLSFVPSLELLGALGDADTVDAREPTGSLAYLLDELTVGYEREVLERYFAPVRYLCRRFRRSPARIAPLPPRLPRDPRQLRRRPLARAAAQRRPVARRRRPPSRTPSAPRGTRIVLVGGGARRSGTRDPRSRHDVPRAWGGLGHRISRPAQRRARQRGPRRRAAPLGVRRSAGASAAGGTAVVPRRCPGRVAR